jgi:hypothetical protein
MTLNQTYVHLLLGPAALMIAHDVWSFSRKSADEPFYGYDGLGTGPMWLVPLAVTLVFLIPSAVREISHRHLRAELARQGPPRLAPILDSYVSTGRSPDREVYIFDRETGAQGWFAYQGGTSTLRIGDEIPVYVRMPEKIIVPAELERASLLFLFLSLFIALLVDRIYFGEIRPWLRITLARRPAPSSSIRRRGSVTHSLRH